MSKNIKFQFDGKLYDIQVERNGNVLTVENEGKSYLVSLAKEVSSAAPKAPKSAQPAAAAAAAPAPAAQAASPAPAAAAAGGASSEKAAITGTIKEIKVAQGTAVKPGDLLIIMEAMKMDIEVFATKSGTITAIHVTAGVNVTEGQPLLDIG
ncbi:MAG: acetyl-CoA carboxylase biotin carboxyl carrier protein subunit [Spirochaetales bacterium]|nr:acetyl-CoA carboxylase biotin carboxyl carrier protein subunit [Spirochaetales bacterium]